LDIPVVVVTHQVPTDWVDAHPTAPFTFVTDGVRAAVERAQELAGDRVVSISGGTIARQCLELDLLDEVAIDLVPVVMGAGNRPFFGQLESDEVTLDNPTVCIRGDRVTHLVFPISHQRVFVPIAVSLATPLPRDRIAHPRCLLSKSLK
jgi:dihydrofolate reductase